VTLRAWAAPAVVTVAVTRALDARTEPGWRRLNFRGSSVTLSLGPGVVAGLLTGIALDADRQNALAAMLSVAGAGVAGLFDDRASTRAEERAVKGFAGHLGALARGKASAGSVKLVAIGATSLAAAAIRTGASVDTAIDGCLVAGCANLVNLLDLRPGRALKVAGAAAIALTPGGTGPYQRLAVTTTATVVAALPPDLAERSMLGDTGANALGAAIGSALCGRPRRTRLAALAVVAGLTALSEKVSFSAVIAGSPVLSRFDRLGGRHD
jgi:UDP-GlcNAc:undecaprenyl-phosphate/decaprenyl-phosphate GlcNAc-1-phosphate transferase